MSNECRNVTPIKEVKEKVVNLGITEELEEFLNNWLDKAKEEHEEKRIGTEVKEAIVKIALDQVEKLGNELRKCKNDDQEWFKIMEKLDKISDLIRWY